MARSLFSSSWYRVAELRPRLRSHARFHRQRFRGQTWYVLQDSQSGRFHRVSPAARTMISLMDGRRTVREIWELTGARMGDDQPTQDETIRLLSQLHSADLLVGEVPPDMAELAERSSRQAKRDLLARIKNPLAVRFALLDPDRFLTATLPLVRPLFGPAGLVLWLALVAAGAAVAGLNFSALAADVADRVLAAQNLALIVLVYPFVKALHELGHGYAAKVRGGEVHEFGIMLLVFVPVPYVDASAASAFRDKRHRAVVGAAGIMVELALAAVAAILWVNAEPGLVRAVAFNVMLIGGVSTLLFNGNPLLRFDGYYVFADLIEVPNLGTRANRYVFYLIQRYLFGIEDVENPATAPGERGWFVFYALASFVYRLGVVFGIAVFVATKLFFFGAVMAIWAVANMFVMPVVKGVRFVAANPRLRGRRRRAAVISAAGALAVALALFAVPLPYATVAEGIVWVPERSAVRAETEGVVAAIVAPPGAAVAPGRVLMRIRDPLLAPRVELVAAQLAEMRLRLESVRLVDRVQADIFDEQVRHLRARLARDRERQANLTIRAAGAGRFVVPAATDLPGRFVRQGDLLGYVIEPVPPTVRVVVPQADADLVRRRTRRVEVRFAGRLDRVLPARIVREVPSARREVPSLALTTEGGGRIALDPAAGGKTPKALEPIFQFDVAVAAAAPAATVGGRVFVRFDHGSEPIAWRLLRTLRQVFLKRFNV